MVNLPSDRRDDVPGVVEKNEVDNIFLGCMHQRRRIINTVCDKSSGIVGKYLAPGYEATGRQWPYTGGAPVQARRRSRGLWRTHLQCRSRRPSRSRCGRSASGLIGRHDVLGMINLVEKAVEGFVPNGLLQKLDTHFESPIFISQRDSFNLSPSIARRSQLMNARMSADMSSSFSHCSLYKVTGK